MSDEFDVDAAARAHHDRVTGHDLPIDERAARFRKLTADALVRKQFCEAISGASEERWCAGWHDGIVDELRRKGGLWLRMAEAAGGWPVGLAGEDGWAPLSDAERATLAGAATPAAPPWRVGRSYGIHVYEVGPNTPHGDRPVGTFSTREDAERAVVAANRGIVPDGEFVLMPPMGWLNRIDEVLRELVDTVVAGAPAGDEFVPWTHAQLAAFRKASEDAQKLVQGWHVGLDNHW